MHICSFLDIDDMRDINLINYHPQCTDKFILFLKFDLGIINVFSHSHHSFQHFLDTYEYARYRRNHELIKSLFKLHHLEDQVTCCDRHRNKRRRAGHPIMVKGCCSTPDVTGAIW